MARCGCSVTSAFVYSPKLNAMAVAKLLLPLHHGAAGKKAEAADDDDAAAVAAEGKEAHTQKQGCLWRSSANAGALFHLT